MQAQGPKKNCLYAESASNIGPHSQFTHFSWGNVVMWVGGWVGWGLVPDLGCAYTGGMGAHLHLFPGVLQDAERSLAKRVETAGAVETVSRNAGAPPKPAEPAVTGGAVSEMVTVSQADVVQPRIHPTAVSSKTKMYPKTLFVTVVWGKLLMGTERHRVGRDTSDPFLVLELGGQELRTQVWRVGVCMWPSARRCSSSGTKAITL